MPDLSEIRAVIAEEQKQKVFGITPLTTLLWAKERLANSKRIMGMKTGTERRGWQEDTAYWEDIVSQLEGYPAALRALQALAEIEEDEQGIMSPISKILADFHAAVREGK